MWEGVCCKGVCSGWQVWCEVIVVSFSQSACNVEDVRGLV